MKCNNIIILIFLVLIIFLTSCNQNNEYVFTIKDSKTNIPINNATVYIKIEYKTGLMHSDYKDTIIYSNESGNIIISNSNEILNINLFCIKDNYMPLRTNYQYGENNKEIRLTFNDKINNLNYIFASKKGLCNSNTPALFYKIFVSNDSIETYKKIGYNFELMSNSYAKKDIWLECDIKGNKLELLDSNNHCINYSICSNKNNLYPISVKMKIDQLLDITKYLVNKSATNKIIISNDVNGCILVNELGNEAYALIEPDLIDNSTDLYYSKCINEENIKGFKFNLIKLYSRNNIKYSFKDYDVNELQKSFLW